MEVKNGLSLRNDAQLPKSDVRLLQERLNSSVSVSVASARGADESIKPGVERSGTPGTQALKKPSARSARQRKMLHHLGVVDLVRLAAARFTG
jgi:hypothetical protein